MTNNETYEYFKKVKNCNNRLVNGYCLFDNCSECEFDYDLSAWEDAFSTVNEALEKQIAKKPINKLSRELLLPEEKCVECGTILFTSDRYCPYCGQRIDWSEVE